MPNGGKTVTINTLERAVSNDINRAQTFAGADRDEIARWAANVALGSEDVDASSLDSETTTLTNPAAGEIWGGLTVRPQIGTLNVLIDAGIAMVLAPDTDADASNYKLARSVGVVTPGALVMAANPAGSIRIDVIECQYVLDPNAETDNRDIFDSTTGAFVPTSVSKAAQGKLNFRVRQGTAGSGYPGTAAGWLPLCVASLAPATTTNDTVTFWDVRPLVADRIRPTFNLARVEPRQVNKLSVDTTTPGVGTLQGTVEANVSGGRYRVGGTILADIDAAANWAGGAVVNGQGFVYLMTPYGLPRWANYTTAASGSRKPTNPRGIVVVSSVAPSAPSGAPSAILSLPSGLTTSSTEGVCIGASTWTGGQAAGFIADGREVQAVGYQSPAGVAIAAGAYLWNITPAGGAGVLTYPGNATAVHVQINIAATLPASSGSYIQPQFWIQNLAGSVTFATIPAGDSTISNGSVGGITSPWSTKIWVPLGFLQAAGFKLKLLMNSGGGGLTLGTGTATVVGWRF